MPNDFAVVYGAASADVTIMPVRHAIVLELYSLAMALLYWLDKTDCIVEMECDVSDLV